VSERLVIRLIPQLAPPELHEAVWRETGLAAGWCFGHSSGTTPGPPFWKLDLDANPVVTRLWHHARSQCEEHLGRPLRVLRQYANGHTYGQGGRLHQDDFSPGTYTLLYYPMPEWESDWDGETVFENGKGEIVASIRPLPNRAVLFDSRIPHVGRAPSRQCPALRVTIAFKLASADAPTSAA
jgi:SM-20-related protein